MTGRGAHLDTAAAGQTTDGGLRDALDVVTQNLAVTLGAALAEALATVHQVSARCDMPPTKKRKTNPFPRPDIVIECV